MRRQTPKPFATTRQVGLQGLTSIVHADFVCSRSFVSLLLVQLRFCGWSRKYCWHQQLVSEHPTRLKPKTIATVYSAKTHCQSPRGQAQPQAHGDQQDMLRWAGKGGHTAASPAVRNHQSTRQEHGRLASFGKPIGTSNELLPADDGSRPRSALWVVEVNSV